MLAYARAGVAPIDPPAGGAGDFCTGPSSGRWSRGYGLRYLWKSPLLTFAYRANSAAQRF
eukprot:1664410-Amphidinium_carterae.1